MNALNTQEKERIFDLCLSITAVIEEAQMRDDGDGSNGDWIRLIKAIEIVDDLYSFINETR